MAKLIPKISAGSIGKVVTSPEVIAIGSASFVAPLIEPHISKFIDSIPILRNHGRLAILGLSILILLLASRMKSGVFRAIVIGVAGANFFVVAIPTIRQFAGR